ncbi:hypothetical protein FACS1894193_08720 [Bacilli bacterium]|nr:hypothetical protein FACS1894193_08720 [Bacilli bacterium]GHU46037.1 hypothetical protein FACS1894194_3010 [Bacilli bacterium]
MKKIKEEMNQKGYGSGQSGKKWLYASLVLASIVGGVALETTGITSKVLSYLQKETTADVVQAMSSAASVLARGTILQPDFYASVSDFTVPATVGQDFSNNATLLFDSKISPKFNGPVFMIPSASNANAIAAFNQPLDPSQNFSISGEVTVPDARIAAAGFYISDVLPENIVDKLGTGNNNGQGSSGALKNDAAAYTDHYMLFSGFHNDGGYAAILASGTDYTRTDGKYTGSGNSKYMDKDYVSFSSSTRNNVKIWVTIDYNATNGIATVIYRHNSATTNSGTGTYDKNSKSAVVQFQINRSKPVYLGIVGNGDKSDSRGEFTSQSVVTSVTGAYLTTNRNLEFKDEAGNVLALPSRVLMPRGGRLGIGNGDTTTPYYFDKPDMPSGYTYLASLNPTTYVGSSGSTTTGRVIYLRDTQQGTVKHVNHLTRKNLRTDAWQAKTNEMINKTTDALSGYYMIDQDAIVGRGVSNVSTSADGARVTWTHQIDNTSNGTSTIDSNPQEANAYELPSVQERLLTITKPDGTTVTEKQTSTTDTDFTALGGQYVLSGYRAVVDGTPVTDAEMALGIPGEVTDKTPNLKAATDSVPQKHAITYQAEPQKANIVYQDVTIGAELKTDNISGLSDTPMAYDTASCIATYLAQGYVVKSNQFTDGAENFDNDSSVDQTYLVELVRDSAQHVETKTITHEVTYTVKHGLVPAPANYTTRATITHTYFVDQTNGQKITTDLTAYALNGVIADSLAAPNYTSDHKDVTVTLDGQITFAAAVIPTVKNHISTVTANTSLHYTTAKDGEKMLTSVVYQLDDTINVTMPIDTIFYNKLTDMQIKSPAYQITNNSGAPVKVSVDNFKASVTNPVMPADFALNLTITGKQVVIPSAKLVDKGAIQVTTGELMTLANCLDQYASADSAVTTGQTLNNVAAFTYKGSATTPDTRKLGYTLSLKFDGGRF